MAALGGVATSRSTMIICRRARLFTDESSADFDAAATALVTERVLDLLARVDARG